MILESIKTVLKELKVNKLRTFLTMLGIIVGIFSITMIFALSNATKSFMNNSLSSITTELTQFDVYMANNIELEFVENDLAKYVKNSDKVNKMSKSMAINYTEYDQILELKNDKNNYYDYGTYYAIDENYFELNMSDVEEKDVLYGRFLSRKDIINKMPYVVLRNDTANNIFGRTNVVGEKININNNIFEVVGVLDYDEDGILYQNIANVYISYYYAREYMKVDSSVTYYFSASKNEYTESIKKEIINILDEYIPKEQYSSYSVNLDSLMSEVDSIVGIVELVFVGVAGLSIVVGGIGIMNIMLVSVSERIKETGIRMALGAKNSDIVFQFLVEGIVLTIFSGIIGIILAWLTAAGVNFAMREYTTYKFILSIDIITMIKIIIFCGIIGIVFGIYPAIKAGKLDPVEALKYE